MYKRQALDRPQTIKGRFPIVGPKAWSAKELVDLCEKFSEKQARVLKVSPTIISIAQSVVSFFEPSLNVAERLSFSELSGSGGKLDAPMENTYAAFGLNQADTTTMEGYIKEYYGAILKRLKDIGVDLDIENDQDIAKQAEVSGTPTVHLFKNKELKKQWKGVKARSEYKSALDELIN